MRDVASENTNTEGLMKRPGVVVGGCIEQSIDGFFEMSAEFSGQLFDQILE